MMKLAEVMALHLEMQQRIAALRAQLEQGAAKLPHEQATAALTELEAMTSLLVADIVCLSRTNVWLLMRLNKRRS
jgi:hypothetical protein